MTEEERIEEVTFRLVGLRGVFCPDYEKRCGNTFKTIAADWYCTREKGHTGSHVAHYYPSGNPCPIKPWRS